MPNIFMKVPNICGNVSLQGYEGWVSLSSVDFGVKRYVNTQVGKVQDRQTGISSVSQVVITKRLDRSTNALFQFACTGNAIEHIEIHVCSAQSQLTAYSKYRLENVIIARHHHSVGPVVLPHELLMLDVTKIHLAYIRQNEVGQSESPHVVGYDLTTAKMI